MIACEGAADVTLRALAVEFASPPPEPTDRDTAQGALSLARGTRAVLEDVRIVGASVGVRADGAVLQATRVTVLDSANDAFALRDGARGVLARVWVRSSRRRGVFAQRSRLSVRESLVADCVGIGVVYSEGSAEAGATQCPWAAATDRGGRLDCIDRVALIRNGNVGLYVASPVVASPLELELRSSSITGTRTSATDMSGGDGLFVGAGATVRVDPDLTGAAALGRGTSIVGNARTGVLVSGGELRLRGAVVAENLGPGVFLQSAAHADEIGFSVFHGNGGLGIGATPTTRIDQITCNGIGATHLAMIPTTVGTIAVGDAISVAGVTGSAVQSVSVSDNSVSGSERFAVILAGAVRGSVVNNVGSSNRYGLVLYDGATLARNESNRLDPQANAPATNPGTAAGVRE